MQSSINHMSEEGQKCTCMHPVYLHTLSQLTLTSMFVRGKNTIAILQSEV